MQPIDDKEALKVLTEEWKKTLSFKQRVGRLVHNVIGKTAVEEDDVRTIQ